MILSRAGSGEIRYSTPLGVLCQCRLETGLTQLFNRGAFDVAMQESFAEAEEKKQPLSLVFGDIDHFKKVNDTKGHQVGDDVLRETAARLMNIVGDKGRTYRYGGEEIVIIVRNYSAGEAVTLAERCRRDIEGTPVSGIAVTMSFGVACFPDHASGASGLIKTADDALYDAKNRGRNLVRLSGDPAPTQQGPREPERKLPIAGKLTEQQKAEFRKKLLRHHQIECPEDQVFFDVHDVTALGDIGRHFLITCPECGLSDEL